MKQKRLDDYLEQSERLIDDDDYIVDLHVHSKYSRATSRNMTLKAIATGSRVKGLNIVGTGDALHPAWLRELRSTLRETEGLFEYEGVKFVLSAEVNTVFQRVKSHRIHSILLFPSVSKTEEVSEKLSAFGDLSQDGRPTLSLDPVELLDILSSVDDSIELIPAHVWTPWFSVFGATSGFNSLEECFGERASRIHSLETGLSSDPEMNWMISSLDRMNLLSNSDAHSHHPWRLGREANVFTLAHPGYKEMLSAVRNGSGLKMTLEVPPEFGKYHWSGHRNCNVSLPPEEAVKASDICPVCGRKLTIGVEERVYQLADRKKGFRPEGKPGFIRTLPLHEILMTASGTSSYGSVSSEYEALVKRYGSEYQVLLNAPIDELLKINRRGGELIKLLRTNRLKVNPGYDGVYGTVAPDQHVD